MSDADAPGLRERKRIATRKSIQHAVLRLALDRGLEHLTVEDISRVADVSPRTFFNYFVSKEAAIVGDAPRLLDDDRVKLFASGGPTGDLFADLGDLIAHGADHASEDREMLVMRRELHGKYPQLFALRMAGMRAFEEQLSAVVAKRLEHDDPALAQSPDRLASRSHLVTMVAFGAMRHGWTSWADAGAEERETLAERMRSSFADLGDLFVRGAAV